MDVSKLAGAGVISLCVLALAASPLKAQSEEKKETMMKGLTMTSGAPTDSSAENMTMPETESAQANTEVAPSETKTEVPAMTEQGPAALPGEQTPGSAMTNETDLTSTETNVAAPSQPQAAMNAEAAPSGEDMPAKWFWGEVVSVDANKKELTIKHLDYETFEETQSTLVATDKTKFENVSSLSQVLPGDHVILDYETKGDIKELTLVVVEKEKEATTEAPAATQMNQTATESPSVGQSPKTTPEDKSSGTAMTTPSATPEAIPAATAPAMMPGMNATMPQAPQEPAPVANAVSQPTTPDTTKTP